MLRPPRDSIPGGVHPQQFQRPPSCLLGRVQGRRVLRQLLAHALWMPVSALHECPCLLQHLRVVTMSCPPASARMTPCCHWQQLRWQQGERELGGSQVPPHGQFDVVALRHLFCWQRQYPPQQRRQRLASLPAPA